MARKLLGLKVYYDEKTGDIVAIEPTKRFDTEGKLFQIDVIQDASILAEKIYQYERDLLFEEFDQNPIIGES